MTRLSVNINKIALIRNSRPGNFPNLSKFATDCESFGAEGITVHPRPDERHIKYSDLYILKDQIKTEFNIEGYPSEEFLRIILQIKPDQCTLVPDPPNVLTSDSGWDTIGRKDFLRPIIARLQDQGIRVSLFLNPEEDMVEASKDLNAERIELYTGIYAKLYETDKEKAIFPHKRVYDKAIEIGLEINAGHDLNLQNLQFYKRNLPNLKEVSIGHALICDALYFGLENVIPMYKAKML